MTQFTFSYWAGREQIRRQVGAMPKKNNRIERTRLGPLLVPSWSARYGTSDLTYFLGVWSRSTNSAVWFVPYNCWHQTRPWCFWFVPYNCWHQTRPTDHGVVVRGLCPLRNWQYALTAHIVARVLCSCGAHVSSLPYIFPSRSV